MTMTVFQIQVMPLDEDAVYVGVTGFHNFVQFRWAHTDGGFWRMLEYILANCD